MPTRRKLIVGNWKMHKTLGTARSDFLHLAELVRPVGNSAHAKIDFAKVDVGIAAPAPFLAELASRRSSVSVYAQNAHWATQGAFTGELSASMLTDLSVAGSLVAHSERRQMNAETNQTAGLRFGTLLRAGLEAVYCVGETRQEREAGKVFDVVRSQIVEAFAASGLRGAFEWMGSDPHRPLLSLAYEPVWAIGTGLAATPQQAAEVHGFMRSVLAELVGTESAQRLRILYGGSVTAANASGFLGAADVDGALVGGASLDPMAFANLVQISVDL